MRGGEGIGKNATAPFREMKKSKTKRSSGTRLQHFPL